MYNGALLLLLSLLLALAPADRAAAAKLFTSASASYQRGDYAAALAGFLAAGKIDPEPEVDWNVYACDLALRRFPDAGAALRRYVAARPGDPEAARLSAAALWLVRRGDPELAREEREAVPGDGEGPEPPRAPGWLGRWQRWDER